MLESNKIIQSLWVGKLSALEQTCIKSHLAHGHEFHLYTYGEVKGVPEGCVVKDANEIVPQSEIEKFQNLANFSDRFRFTLLYKKGGWWTDTDSICIKTFDFEEEYVFANLTRDTVSPGVIKTPAGCEIMRWCIEQQDRINWKTCQWPDLGPYMLYKAVHHFKMTRYCHDQETFLPTLTIPGLVSLVPERDFGDKTYAVHLFNEQWRHFKLDKDAVYPPTSTYDRFRRCYLHPQPELKNPKVSIIISCYNYGRFLAQAIDSALEQTYRNIEVIVVDDGSTDDSLKIARSYGDRIKVFTQPNSGNPAGPRNLGLKNSTGELVISLDADDWLQPDFIERTLPHMKENIGVVGVHTTSAAHPSALKPSIRQIAEGNCCAQTALMLRSALQGVGGWVKTGYEDWNLWISVMEAGWEIHVIGERLYNYRTHGDGRYVRELNPNHANLVDNIHKLHPALYARLNEVRMWPRLSSSANGQSAPTLYVHTPDPANPQHWIVPPSHNPLYVHTPDPRTSGQAPYEPPPHQPVASPRHHVGYHAPKSSDGKAPLYVHTPDPSK